MKHQFKRNSGDRVVLIGSEAAMAKRSGALSAPMLREEGGFDPKGVPITRVDGEGYVVTLPARQYQLAITEADIDQRATAALTPYKI